MILVTGGAGFVGANFVLERWSASDEAVLNPATLTCAANLGALGLQEDSWPCDVLGRAGIRERTMGRALFVGHHPCTVVHLAANQVDVECYA